MADEKLTELDLAVEAEIVPENLLYLVDDPTGVPESLKTTVGSLIGGLYKIVPSVTSNNLTVTITHLDGTNPSATNPLRFRIGDSIKLVTASLATTKNAGTNWCNAGGTEMNGNPIDFFVYLINETGASAGVKVGFSRIPYALTMGDFVNTSTDDKYIAGNWTNFNSTDEVILIGRFRAQLSVAASHNWSIASQLVVNRPIYETDFLVWNPTVGGFSSVPTFVVRYKLRGDILYVAFSGIADGTSNATTFTVTVPFLSKNVSNYFQYAPVSWLKDNNSTTNTPGTVFTTPGSRTLSLRKGGFATWTASSNKNGAFTIFMQIE